MSLFSKLIKRNNKSQSVTTGASDAARLDGLTPDRVKLVCSFQESVESAGNCDYAALAIALASARKLDKPCNLFTLRASYNDAVYASAGVGYNASLSSR